MCLLFILYRDRRYKMCLLFILYRDRSYKMCLLFILVFCLYCIEIEVTKCVFCFNCIEIEVHNVYMYCYYCIEKVQNLYVAVIVIALFVTLIAVCVLTERKALYNINVFLCRG